MLADAAEAGRGEAPSIISNIILLSPNTIPPSTLPMKSPVRNYLLTGLGGNVLPILVMAKSNKLAE